MPEELSRMYERLKRVCVPDLGATAVADLLGEMATRARQMLEVADRVQLSSRTGKRFFSFREAKQSRPVNEDLFASRRGEFDGALRAFVRGFAGDSSQDIVRATYTIAYSVFAAHDVRDVGRKASATVFEILIGHIVARALSVAPRKKVRIPESGADLPTDYVFDPGSSHRKIHLPIKTSTRERAVQAWVHQLVLERIFGAGVYRGILVVASETKRDARTGEVIEICVPRQLQMFQSRVAEITRIYYLDPPRPYMELAKTFPRVDVKPFGEALEELPQLLSAV